MNNTISPWLKKLTIITIVLGMLAGVLKYIEIKLSEMPLEPVRITIQ